MVTRRQFLVRGAALSAGSTMAATLGACSSNSKSGSGNATATASKDIAIGMNSGLVAQFQRYAADFQKAKPNFQVTVKAVPDSQAEYIQQLVTQGLSKTLPDIVFNYDGLNQTLNGNHLLYDMKPWLDSSHDGLGGDQFQPNFLAQYNVGTVITGIPVSADASVLFWNKTLFKKYGITDYPKNTWTYDQMYQVAAEITRKSGGKVYGMAAPIGDGSGIFTFYPLLKAYGSNLYDPATNKLVFANAGGIQAWTEALKPYTEKFGLPYSTKSQPNVFPGGTVAMSVNARPSVATYRQSMKQYDWDVAQMPTVNGQSSTGGGSYSMSISAGSTNKEGAWQFLSWFFSTDGGLKAAEPDGVIPATKEGLANGSWLHDKNPVPPSLIPVTKYEVQNAILPNPVPDSVQPKVVPAIQKAIQQVVLQNVPVKKAFTDAQDALNGQLK